MQLILFLMVFTDYIYLFDVTERPGKQYCKIIVQQGRFFETDFLTWHSFCTDFPAVNWVLQFDCPEDANTYIHRAGRTAR